MTVQGTILTVTVNPALDLTTSVTRLLPRAKLRCSAAQYDPGGGGVNVSRVIHELGGQSAALIAVGGSTGEHLAHLLEARGVSATCWPIDGETRTSFTVMEGETSEHYRFVLPGPIQQAGKTAGLMDAVAAAMPADCSYVVLSGSLLPGLPPDTYARLITYARSRGAKVLLDAHGAELKLALSARPDILRLNHIEAGELLNEGQSGRSASGLCQKLLAQEVAEIVLVSHDEQGTSVGSRAGGFTVRPPKVKVRSTVGAGDSLVGALILGLARGWSLVDAARYGVAAAAAAVLAEGADLCDRRETERLMLETAATAHSVATV
jgi:6-phosphofructokinase 2